MIAKSPDDMEERLRREAQRFCVLPNGRVLGKLLAEHRRRQSQRTAVTAGGVATLSLTLLLAVVLCLPRVADRLTSRAIDLKARDGAVAAGESNRGRVPSLPDVLAHTSASRALDVTVPTPLPRRAIPILLMRQGENGRHDVVRAWYIPRTETAIRYESLSSAEQRAVRTLLGKDRVPKRNAT